MNKAILLLGALVGLLLSPASAATVYLLTTDGKLTTTSTANPAATSSLTITGVNASETLVGIDVRPQNQRLYALGVNATADTATLYALAPETGVATAVGTAGGISLVAADGTTVVDFPSPASVQWDMDFNPTVDRLRVVAGSLNFRVDPNSGTAVDGNLGGGAVPGVNADGPINGGTTTISGAAYTNNQPNSTVTTLYTLDGVSNSLFIQNPANSGTQTNPLAVTLGGNPLDFAVQGFDIAEGVNTASNNAAVAAGAGFAVLTVGGQPALYTINLTNGAAALLGNVPATIGMAVRTEVPAAIGLSTGAALVRFSLTTPGTSTSVAVGGLVGGEVLAAIDWRPSTGQLFGLGINATANTGTLYRLDPQTGGAIAVGTSSQIALVDNGGSPVDLPDPAAVSYGFDFNPTVDRIRVITASGLNFRINPNTGAPVDGNAGVAGVNPDGGLNGYAVTHGATAYSNSFGGATATTQFTLDAATNSLAIQNPSNNGTQQLIANITLSGSPLDFSLAGDCFDLTPAASGAVSNGSVTGDGIAALTVGGTQGLYRINLINGKATFLGASATVFRGLAVAFTPPEITVELAADVESGAGTLTYSALPSGQSEDQVVGLFNTGDGTLTYSTSLAAGTNYTVTANGSGSLGAGQFALITVHFAPQQLGTLDDTLHISSNDSDEATFDVALTGTGLATLADDAIAVAGTSSRLLVLANDGLADDAEITGVSNGNIQIDGRALIIPAGFTGTFTYSAASNGVVGIGTVTVSAATPVANAARYAGLLFNSDGLAVGSATAQLNKKGLATVKFAAGIARASGVFNLSTVGVPATAFTALGYTVVLRQPDGTVRVGVSALGGSIQGTLHAVPVTATAGKHNIALASFDATYPGGGYATATVSKTAGVKIIGVLVDGLPFTAATTLREDGSFTFFTPVTVGAKPPATLTGEFQTADLARTDVTGELIYQKFPQAAGAKGTHLGGVATLLTANGCRFDGTALLPAGAATLTISGADFLTPEVSAVTIGANGAPAIAGSLKSWTGVSKKLGKFTAAVSVPGVAKLVKGGGLYLPKSNQAWGYFSGTTSGGRLTLTVP